MQLWRSYVNKVPTVAVEKASILLLVTASRVKSGVGYGDFPSDRTTGRAATCRVQPPKKSHSNDCATGDTVAGKEMVFDCLLVEARGQNRYYTFGGISRLPISGILA